MSVPTTMEYNGNARSNHDRPRFAQTYDSSQLQHTTQGWASYFLEASACLVEATLVVESKHAHTYAPQLP